MTYCGQINPSGASHMYSYTYIYIYIHAVVIRLRLWAFLFFLLQLITSLILFVPFLCKDPSSHRGDPRKVPPPSGTVRVPTQPFLVKYGGGAIAF